MKRLINAIKIAHRNRFCKLNIKFNGYSYSYDPRSDIGLNNYVDARFTIDRYPLIRMILIKLKYI